MTDSLDLPDDKKDALRWFLRTVSQLREQMSDEDFAAFRHWLEFLTEAQTVAH